MQGRKQRCRLVPALVAVLAATVSPGAIAASGAVHADESGLFDSLSTLTSSAAYMDYSDDRCYNQFTAGQTARMQDAWLHFRAS